MKKLERRDFAKQTLKWGGVLSLLAVLSCSDPPKSGFGCRPRQWESPESHAKEPLLTEG